VVSKYYVEQIHGLAPWPGASSSVPIGDRNENVKFLHAKVTTGTGLSGMLLTEDMCIACGEGAVKILQVQRPVKSILSGPRTSARREACSGNDLAKRLNLIFGLR
jgi:methionyl-tRNA formyltransferase